MVVDPNIVFRKFFNIYFTINMLLIPCLYLYNNCFYFCFIWNCWFHPVLPHLWGYFGHDYLMWLQAHIITIHCGIHGQCNAICCLCYFLMALYDNSTPGDLLTYILYVRCNSFYSSICMLTTNIPQKDNIHRFESNKSTPSVYSTQFWK